MENCIRKMDEKGLWEKIQSACLNQNQTVFKLVLYRYTKGFFGKTTNTSEEGIEPRKITAFLKSFCAKYKIDCVIYEKEEKKESYTHVSLAELTLSHITVSNIKNARIFQNRERENIIRKKTISYYVPMENTELVQQLKPLIIQDFKAIIAKKQNQVSIHNNDISVQCLVSQNQLLVDPDYKNYFYHRYSYKDYNGHSLNAMEMSAMALVLLDILFEQLERDYPKLLITKNIRVLNIGVEITITLHK